MVLSRKQGTSIRWTNDSWQESYVSNTMKNFHLVFADMFTGNEHIFFYAY